MKSVLHIGIDLPSHSKEGLRKGFLAAGFTEYNFFNWQSVKLDCGILGCQTRLLRAAQSLQPDLIFCHLQNQDIFDEETAMELSKCGFTVNYTFDVRDAEKTEWMYELAPYFGLTLFACKEDSDEGKRRGLHNVGHIHSSCDTDVYRPLTLSEEEKSKYPEIVFIANNYVNTNLSFPQAQERLEMVNFMKREFGDRFLVTGMNWGDKSKIVNPQEEVLIYNSAKIVICHNNFFRTNYCSDRQWRAISSGALAAIQYYDGCDDDFPNSSIVPYWKTFEELEEMCEFYLVDPLTLGIHRSRQRREFNNYHTWKHRIEQIKKWELYS